mmetsp:Transcript_25588/g.36065  ORF Transcript_25588/g.36065 Transcript_25588/m.36065 type:complete len:227 (-) Transcript_25588:218-898(-)
MSCPWQMCRTLATASSCRFTRETATCLTGCLTGTRTKTTLCLSRRKSLFLPKTRTLTRSSSTTTPKSRFTTSFGRPASHGILPRSRLLSELRPLLTSEGTRSTVGLNALKARKDPGPISLVRRGTSCIGERSPPAQGTHSTRPRLATWPVETAGETPSPSRVSSLTSTICLKWKGPSCPTLTAIWTNATGDAFRFQMQGSIAKFARASELCGLQKLSLVVFKIAID